MDMEAFLYALWQDSIIADRVDEAAKSKVKSAIATGLFNELVVREDAASGMNIRYERQRRENRDHGFHEITSTCMFSFIVLVI